MAYSPAGTVALVTDFGPYRALDNRDAETTVKPGAIRQYAHGQMLGNVRRPRADNMEQVAEHSRAAMERSGRGGLAAGMGGPWSARW
jgi:hypothetical protein